MENKIFRKGNRFDYDAAIKFYGLEMLYASFVVSQLKKNKRRVKPIYSEKRLKKLFFALPCNRYIKLENTVFDLKYLSENPGL